LKNPNAASWAVNFPIACGMKKKPQMIRRDTSAGGKCKLDIATPQAARCLHALANARSAIIEYDPETRQFAD
jgi:hypothetical protein